MSYNRSLLSQITKDLNKKPSKPKVPKNQWQHPGEITNIPSNNITMDAVSYPVLGVPNVGQPQMMYPDQQYHYPDADNVTEYPMMGNGGYVVTRSNDRKGKTHKVTGPDGTVKYFGDSSMGQHPKDPARKKAFYARHKHNLEHNPFFRAFARKTWAEGGITPEYGDGGEMIRRADGSYSKRGLWDNIRANKGSGKKPTKEMLEQERKIKSKMQFGGLWDSNRTAWVDSVNNANMDKNFVQRMYNPNAPQMFLPGDKRPSTHFMESGDARAYPTVVQRPGNKYVEWLNQNNPNSAYNYASNSGQYIQFPNDAQANWYAANGYKQGTNVVTGKQKKQYGGTMKKYQTAGQVIKPVKGYIDLQKYGIDPITEEGLAKAKELNDMYPGSKFVCTANGCADIAQRIAKVFGNDFPRRNAWEYRGSVPEVYTAPGYQAELDAGKPLHDPRSYAFPEEVKKMSGVLVGLNRKDNYDGHMAKTRAEANDSRDYINRMLYSGPNAMHEHIGYYNDGIMYHGTAGNKSHPAFFVLDDPKDGIALPGIARYNVVNAMEEPGILNTIANGFTSLGNGISNLFDSKKQKGGSIYDYMTSHGMNGSFSNRKKLFNQYFGQGYTGTADQNMQMLQMLQQGKVKLPTQSAPAQAIVTVPYAPKAAFPGATTGLSFLNQTRAPYKPGKAPQYKAQPKQRVEFTNPETTIPDLIRNAASAIGVPLPVTQLGLWGASKVLGNNIAMSDNSLSPQQQEILYQTIKNAKERNARENKRNPKKDYDPNTGGMAYGDYGNQGYGSPEDFENWLVNGKQAKVFNASPKEGIKQFYDNVTKNPVYQMATAVGRGVYHVDPNDPNIIHYTDSYDFVRHDKDKEIFNGATETSYQPFRRELSDIEAEDAERNERNRVHFSFNVKEMEDRLAKKKGSVAMRYGGLTRFQNAGQSNAPKVTAKVNPFMPVFDPNEANQEYQLSDDQTFFTGTQPISHEAGIAANLKQSIAKQNPELKTAPFPGSAAANSIANTISSFGDSILGGFDIYAKTKALDNQRAQEEANRQMLRSQNASWNQQYSSTMNRGNFSQGPSSYGLFKPNQLFAQQGMQVPLSMDEAAKYTVDSIDSLAGANTIGIGTPDIQLAQYAQQQAMPQSAETTAPAANEPTETSNASLRDLIAQKESNNNYKAVARKKDGSLASSAAGKYQFLWDTHKDTIRTVTGVNSKTQFLNNPQAQEAYFDYWDKNILTPKAQKIKQEYNPQLSTDEIKMLIHFQGPQGAERYFKTGKYTKDEFGTSPMQYLGKNVDTKQGVKATNLNPKLMEFVSNMGSRFPGLTLSSANDNQHMRGSKHYANKAIDIGANSSNPKAYNQLASFLAKNPTIKSKYGIEDIINEGDHLHVELMRQGGEYELTADQIMQIKAMGGDVEFI